MSRRRILFPASYRPRRHRCKGVVRHEADVSATESQTCEQARFSAADENPRWPEDPGASPASWPQAAHSESGLQVGDSWGTRGPTIDRPKTNAFRDRGEFASGVRFGRFCVRVRGPEPPTSMCSRHQPCEASRGSGRSSPATVEGSWTETSFAGAYERSGVPRSFLAWGGGDAAWTYWSEAAPRRTIRGSPSCGPSYSD